MTAGPLVSELLRAATSGEVSVTFVTGTVTVASPLMVLTATTATAAKKLASYTPTLNDRVAVLILGGSDRLVLGTIN